jgi:hypothetical protein
MKELIFILSFLLFNSCDYFNRIFTPFPGQTAHLIGEVKDKETLEPLSGIKVTCGDKKTKTDTRGKYILKDLLVGKHLLKAQGEKYHPYQAEVIIKYNTENKHEILLKSVYFGTDITENTTWGTTNGCYYIRKKLKIEAQLEIIPGVKIYFTQDAGLIVTSKGELIAVGRADAKILLSSQNEGEKWSGIIAKPGASLNLEYVQIERARRGLYIETEKQLTLEHNIFKNNTWGIYFKNVSPSPIYLELTESVFSENENEGVKIYKANCSISRCEFISNGRSGVVSNARPLRFLEKPTQWLLIEESNFINNGRFAVEIRNKFREARVERCYIEGNLCGPGVVVEFPQKEKIPLDFD